MGSQKSLSRRDFLKVSALAAGGIASANLLGMPLLTMAQDTTEITITGNGRALGVAYSEALANSFNAKMQADGIHSRFYHGVGWNSLAFMPSSSSSSYLISFPLAGS